MVIPRRKCSHSAVEPAGLRSLVHLQCLCIEMEIIWTGPLLGMLEVKMWECTAAGCWTYSKYDVSLRLMWAGCS
jgi:hypothetical protein